MRNLTNYFSKKLKKNLRNMGIMSLVLFLSVLSISAAPSTRGIGVVGDNCISLRFQYYTVMENVRRFSVEVSMDYPLDYSTVVILETEDGTAYAGGDYVGSYSVLIFKPGEIRKNIMVDIIDDDVYEEDEFFYFRARSPSSEALLTVLILDNDHS